MQKFKMAAKSGRKMILQKWPVDFADNLWDKNFVEVPLSHFISEIKMFLHLTQKIKLAKKNDGKMIFAKSCQ